MNGTPSSLATFLPLPFAANLREAQLAPRLIETPMRLSVTCHLEHGVSIEIEVQIVCMLKRAILVRRLASKTQD